MLNSCCERLEYLFKQRKQDVWRRPAKEPDTAFQDLFQLFIYALCDQGLLFREDGCLRTVPDSDFWKESVNAYHQFAFAMRDRNFAYIQLHLLRQHLDEHQQQRNLYQREKIPSLSEDMDDKSRFFYDQLCHHESLQGKSVLNKISYALSAIDHDRLLKSAASLYLFFALTQDCRPEDFKAALKANQKRFPRQDNASALATSRKDCLLFADIMNAFWWSRDYSTTLNYLQFDPFSFLIDFQKQGLLQISDDELVKLANLCMTCFITPSRKEELLSFKQDIHGISIGEIMRALFVLIDGQTYDAAADAKDDIVPRSFKASIETILRADIFPIPKTGDTLEPKRRLILDHLANVSYDFAWEVFWLITGYIPPIDSGFSSKCGELYRLCDHHLKSLWQECYDAFFPESSTSQSCIAYPPDLQADIQKVRLAFASKANRKIYLRDFMHKLSAESIPTFRELQDFCRDQYSQFAGKSANLKSFDYASDILTAAMVDEAFIQVGSSLYQRVFSLLASLNLYIWPM